MEVAPPARKKTLIDIFFDALDSPHIDVVLHQCRESLGMSHFSCILLLRWRSDERVKGVNTDPDDSPQKHVGQRCQKDGGGIAFVCGLRHDSNNLWQIEDEVSDGVGGVLSDHGLVQESQQNGVPLKRPQRITRTCKQLQFLSEDFLQQNLLQ